jgi:hypothetical protein
MEIESIDSPPRVRIVAEVAPDIRQRVRMAAVQQNISTREFVERLLLRELTRLDNEKLPS